MRDTGHSEHSPIPEGVNTRRIRTMGLVSGERGKYKQEYGWSKFSGTIWKLLEETSVNNQMIFMEEKKGPSKSALE